MKTMMNGAAEQQKNLKTLEQIRQKSLEASRRGDFRTVAKLTIEAARMNLSIQKDVTNSALF